MDPKAPVEPDLAIAQEGAPPDPEVAKLGQWIVTGLMATVFLIVAATLLLAPPKADANRDGLVSEGEFVREAWERWCRTGMGRNPANRSPELRKREEERARAHFHSLDRNHDGRLDANEQP